MTNFKLTKELAALISESSLSSEDKASYLENDTIGHDSLVKFYHECRPKASMLELLKTTQLVVPNKNVPNEAVPKTKEFIQTMETLRLRAKEEEYQRLVNPSLARNTLYEPKFDDEPFDTVRQHKETKNHITTMFNIFISVASVVYAIWYWTGSSWG
ncbi:hypothetical protein JCM33374_g5761 [Metschnikowia sp. JCM 33374]|nr:hypothetical protein JCM33374_g5761 [Metschnikowia sp. JCM 33374]